MAELKNNPAPIWGSKKDDLVEKAKVKAVKYYLNKNKPKAIENKKSKRRRKSC